MRGLHPIQSVRYRLGITDAINDLFDDRPDMEPDFRQLYARCKPFTMTSLDRMYALWNTCRHIANRIDGDFVECGVWKGGSSMLAGHTFQEFGDPRHLWLYDTFEGMTEPTERDRRLDGREVTWEEIQEDEWLYCHATLGEVQQNLAGLEASYIVGRVEDTIPDHMPDRIALLRLDTDWYESTKHELEHLWPRLVPGGVLILDDYGLWAGQREAVDEFFAGRDDAPLLSRIDHGRVGVKLH